MFKFLKFEYTNYKNVKAKRMVYPRRIWFGKNDYHDKHDQWFINGTCIDRKEDRSFPLQEIIDGYELEIKGLKQVARYHMLIMIKERCTSGCLWKMTNRVLGLDPFRRLEPRENGREKIDV